MVWPIWAQASQAPAAFPCKAVRAVGAISCAAEEVYFFLSPRFVRKGMKKIAVSAAMTVP